MSGQALWREKGEQTQKKKIRPCPDVSECFFPFSKNTRPHVAYSNRSHEMRLTNTITNTIASLTGHSLYNVRPHPL